MITIKFKDKSNGIKNRFNNIKDETAQDQVCNIKPLIDNFNLVRTID